MAMVFADSRRALGDFSSRRYKQIEREGHVMPRICGPRGLVVVPFVACAAIVAARAAQAEPTGARSSRWRSNRDWV